MNINIFLLYDKKADLITILSFNFVSNYKLSATGETDHDSLITSDNLIMFYDYLLFINKIK
jgi:hypothetical protein